MRRRKPTLDAINHDLDLAGKLLDGAAHKLRDAGFAPRRNVRRVGEALACVSAIQFEIYAARPDLLPRFLADTKFGRRVLSNKRYLDSSRKTRSMTCATTGSDCSRISGLSRERSRSGP